jgi:exodeoxyribonuclease-3
VGWRLDYFFVNKEFMKHVQSSTILYAAMGSDHAPVELDLEWDD